jgi:hypothetical protein
MNICGKSGVLTKIALEVRYRDGYIFLDRCGRTISEILRESPEWMPKGENPQGAGLVSMQNGCTLAFSSLHYVLLLERALGGDPLTGTSIEEFAKQVETIAPILHGQLSLKTFSRIGCRAWFLFEADSKEDAEKWVLGLPFFRVDPKLGEIFDGQISSASASMGVTGPDRSFQISVNAVERQVQLDLGQEILSVRASSLPKRQREHLSAQQKVRRKVSASPQFAAMLDIDAFQDEPPSIDPKDFVRTSLKRFADRLEKAFA